MFRCLFGRAVAQAESKIKNRVGSHDVVKMGLAIFDTTITLGLALTREYDGYHESEHSMPKGEHVKGAKVFLGTAFEKYRIGIRCWICRIEEAACKQLLVGYLNNM